MEMGAIAAGGCFPSSLLTWTIGQAGCSSAPSSSFWQPPVTKTSVVPSQQDIIPPGSLASPGLLIPHHIVPSFLFLPVMKHPPPAAHETHSGSFPAAKAPRMCSDHSPQPCHPLEQPLSWALPAGSTHCLPRGLPSSPA